MLDKTKASFLQTVVPWTRPYLRYAPLSLGRPFMVRLFASYLYTQPPHEAVSSTIFGARMHCHLEDIIQAYIHYFGVWEPNLTAYISRSLSRGDVFVDVGANVGYFSLLASGLVGTDGSVVAIEAAPAIFAALQHNLALNRTTNVRAIPMAVADAPGQVHLYSGPRSNWGKTTTVKDIAADFEGPLAHDTAEVAALPLAELLSPQELERARIIKIDVEGAEWSILPSLAPLLARSRADLELVIEVKPEIGALSGRSPEDLLATLVDAGFHVYALENDYSPYGYVERAHHRRPVRLRGPIRSQIDVVLSRRDAELL